MTKVTKTPSWNHFLYSSIIIIAVFCAVLVVLAGILFGTFVSNYLIPHPIIINEQNLVVVVVVVPLLLRDLPWIEIEIVVL